MKKSVVEKKKAWGGKRCGGRKREGGKKCGEKCGGKVWEGGGVGRREKVCCVGREEGGGEVCVWGGG